MTDGFDHDWVIIGSGFGGSVSALRLVEKGYDVLLLEAGKRMGPDDFPQSNWNVKRWLWAPALGCRGLFQMQFFKHVTVLAGAGYGGGSLTYANTLPIPKRGFFQSPSWGGLADWESELMPHYQTARRMLGAVQTPFLTPPDQLLKEIATERGAADRFESTHVAVYFDNPGKTVPDPFFGGKGPERTGCIRCGACMTGCKHGAKNSLDKNYLYLAERQGLAISDEAKVTRILPRDAGGYILEYERRGQTQRVSARQIVVAAGALGTNKLLLRQKADPEALPQLSDRLGTQVRTNSESLIFVTVKDKQQDLSKGVAIGSIYQIDDNSHLEVVRYGEGSGFFRTMQMPHVGGYSPGFIKLLRALLLCVLHPIKMLRALLVGDWARSTIILLYMKTAEGTLRFRLGRSLFTGLRPGMVTELEGGEAPTASIPEATELAEAFAAKTGGIPFSGFTETLFNIPTTAHILGGCTMGADRERGVIDSSHRAFGYDGLYIIDGSTISANPGVNPSLTITALAERAMSLIPAKQALPGEVHAAE